MQPSVDSQVVPTADRVELREEMLVAVVGDDYPPDQIREAVELLANNEGKFPRGGRALPPPLTFAVQRARLIEAMLTAASELGYYNLTVDDVVKRAAISPRAFYVHFKGKEQCFMAAFDVAAARLWARLDRAVLQTDGDWRDRLRAALEELLSFLALEVDVARTLIVAARVVPNAPTRQDELRARLAAGIDASVAKDLGESPITTAAIGVVGGLEALLYAHLHSNELADPVFYLPELMYFAVCAYAGPVEALEELEAATTRYHRSHSEGPTSNERR